MWDIIFEAARKKSFYLNLQNANKIFSHRFNLKKKREISITFRISFRKRRFFTHNKYAPSKRMGQMWAFKNNAPYVR